MCIFFVFYWHVSIVHSDKIYFINLFISGYLIIVVNQSTYHVSQNKTKKRKAFILVRSFLYRQNLLTIVTRRCQSAGQMWWDIFLFFNFILFQLNIVIFPNNSSRSLYWIVSFDLTGVYVFWIVFLHHSTSVCHTRKNHWTLNEERKKNSPFNQYTLLCLSRLFIARWETDGTTYLRKKKTSLCARKNKSVHS